MSKLHRISQPPITPEFLGKIKAAFRAPTVTASSTPEEIKWAAAQYEVVQWIISRVGDMSTMEEPEPAQEPETATVAPSPEPVPALPWWKRLWHKLTRR